MTATSTLSSATAALFLGLVCFVPLWDRASGYSGTVPIFPDVQASKKAAAAAEYQAQCKKRPKIFAPTAVVKANALTKVFDTPHIFVEDEHVKALDGVTATIQGPGSVALVGPWNSGKSTFLKCLAGLEAPTSGDVTVTNLRKAVYVGRRISSATGKTVRKLLRDEVGAALPGNDNSRPHRDSVEIATNNIMEALDLHGVSLTKDRDLSGGEVYRFAIAMALARGCGSPTPPVLLLDDVFDRSDQRVRVGVEFSLFHLQKKMGVMLIFTAPGHDAIVMELGKQVVEFDNGKIVEVSVHEKSRYARRMFELMQMEIAEQARHFFSEGAATTVEITEDLQQAIHQGNLPLVRQLLHRQQKWRGAEATEEVVNSVVNENGDACIHVAAKFGHAEIVSLLLRHGAETSHLGSRSRTPLQLACIYGHLQAAEVLLEAGADANASLRDASGYEHYAAVRNQADVVYALVEAGADVEAHVDENGGGGTPLHASAVMRCYDAAIALLECGAKVDSKNAFGYSPLHGVARQGGKKGATRTADLLLRWGADETAVDRDGNRPIDVVGNGRTEEGNGRQQGDEVDRLRELLRNAPLDRAWRRRGYVVLCRVFFLGDTGRLQQQPEPPSEEEFAALKRDSFLAGQPCRRLSKTRDPENGMWSELARAEMAPQTPTPQPFVAAASPLDNCDGTRATLKMAASRGSDLATDDNVLKAVLIRLLDFPEEGVFRNTVSYL
eukprot:g7475.t1